MTKLAPAVFVMVLLGAAAARAQDPEPVTMRAYRLTQPLVVDGLLDDAVYHTTEPAPKFLQQEPRVGELATEQTEMWVFFDDRNVYVSARMHDSEPDRMIADEMRRDASIYQNEQLRGHLRHVSRSPQRRSSSRPIRSARVRDRLIIDENTANYGLERRLGREGHRDETGWTSEMVIPFKSLRYPTGKEQVWGINARRWERRINEHSLLSITPPAHRRRTMPCSGSRTRRRWWASRCRRPRNNIELKPYGVSNVTTNRDAAAAGVEQIRSRHRHRLQVRHHAAA